MSWYWVKCVLSAWGQLKRGFRCCHWVKCVLRASGQLQRVFEVLALGEVRFEGMGGS